MEIIITILLSVLAPSVQAQEPAADPLPAFLPIGSEERMLDWIVTNRLVSLNTQIRYTNSSGSYVSYGVAAGNVSFNSYAQYKQYAVSNGWYFFQQYRTNIHPNSTVEFRASVRYFGLLTVLAVNTNLGAVAGVISESFSSITPTDVKVAVSVQNLEKFVVEIEDADPKYVFSWEPQNQNLQPRENAPVRPPEQTKTDLVVLSDWYSTGAYCGRFTITAGGLTRTYTQHGEALVPPLLRIRPGRLDASMAKGSNTVIEGSPDMITWEPIANLPWSLAADRATVPVTVDSDLPCQFYRVYSR